MERRTRRSLNIAAATVLAIAPIVATAPNAGAATVRTNSKSVWNRSGGTCTPKSGHTIENNIYWPNLSTDDGSNNTGANRWWLGNFPHGSYHSSDIDVPTGSPDTHIYKAFPGTGSYACRDATFVSHASGTRTYSCLVVAGSYNGQVARPIYPGSPQNYNGSVDSYFCNP